MKAKEGTSSGLFRRLARVAAAAGQGKLPGWEKRAWLLLSVVAVALRFFQLDAKPPHHDEAIHGHFAWELLHNKSYRYDPTYHGPLQYVVLAGLFALFGESDFVLRSYSAACGAALALAPFLLRRLMGRGPALAMGWLLALSPSFVYFSRFARNDVPVALFTGMAVSLVWLQTKSRRWLLPWAGFFLALHAVSKETIYVTGVLWFVAGLGLVFWCGPSRAMAWSRSFWTEHRRQLLLALGVFAFVCVVFYTVFFTWPQDVLFPLKAVRYWYEQHKIQRVGGPWTYHFPRLL
ncbi:MAG: flippase activity-associated protein Agl23, partial [Thermoanaerobaculum sp.]